MSAPDFYGVHPAPMQIVVGFGTIMSLLILLAFVIGNALYGMIKTLLLSLKRLVQYNTYGTKE